jgi:hypothetical protein
LELKIRLQPKQTELWNLWDGTNYTRIGFGGARGGAKSGGGRRCMLLRRLKYPQTTGLILRRTYPELYKSHIVKLFEEYPEVRQWYNEQRKEIALPNGSRLFFGSAEHESDMTSFYSAEFADIMPDEAQEFSQHELEQLSAANRCTSNNEITSKMVLTFMPGVSETGVPPKGLTYLKRVFVDGHLRGEETKQNWKFIQAFAWDNIEWARKELERDGIDEVEFYSWDDERRRQYFVTRTEYGANLAALTNQYLREAWLYGKWGVFQGQYFPNYAYERHTVEPQSIKLLPWYKRWISCDWGYDHPACVHLHAKLEDGRIYTYAELWGREIGETELGHKIAELCHDQKFSDFVMSWDAFGKLNKATRKSITEMVGDALPKGMPKPAPGDASPGSRISGWRNMYNLLDSGGWIISRDCAKLIECLPTLVRDMERNTEDVLKVDYSENYIGDDAADCARMGLQHELEIAGVPMPMRVERKVEAAQFTDPTSEMIWRSKFEKQEEHKAMPTHFGRRWRRRAVLR